MFFAKSFLDKSLEVRLYQFLIMVMYQEYLEWLSLFVKSPVFEILNTFQVWKAIINFFHDNEHAIMQTAHQKGDENREVDSSTIDIERELQNLDLLMTLLSGK